MEKSSSSSDIPDDSDDLVALLTSGDILRSLDEVDPEADSHAHLPNPEKKSCEVYNTSSDSDSEKTSSKSSEVAELDGMERQQLSLNLLADAKFTDRGIVFDGHDERANTEIMRICAILDKNIILTPAECCLYALTMGTTKQFIIFERATHFALEEDLSHLATKQFEPLIGLLDLANGSHWEMILSRLQLVYAKQLLADINSDEWLTHYNKTLLFKTAAEHALFAPFGRLKQTLYLSSSTLFNAPICASPAAQLFLDEIKKVIPDEYFVTFPS